MGISACTDSGITVGRRAHARLRLCLPADLTLLTGNSRCILEDISTSGAKVRVPSCPKVGACGTLSCGEVDAFFTVQWIEGDCCGLEFDEIQPEETVIGLRWLADNFCKIERRKLEEAVKAWVAGDSKALPY